jgi:hypothetical protein
MSERRNSLSTIITADNRKEILFEMFGDIGELEEGNTTMQFAHPVWVLLYALFIDKQRTSAARSTRRLFLFTAGCTSEARQCASFRTCSAMRGISKSRTPRSNGIRSR